MNRKFFKRAISFAMAAAVSLTTLCGITSVSASAEETQDVYRTIFYTDFDSEPNKAFSVSKKDVTDANEQAKYKTIPNGWNDASFNLATETWTEHFGRIQTDGDDYRFGIKASYWQSYFINKKFNTPLTSGRYRFSFDYKVGGESYLNGKNQLNFDFNINHNTDDRVLMLGGDGIITVWSNNRFNDQDKAEEIKINILKENETAKSKLIDKGINVAFEVDLTAKKEYMYIDGEKVDEAKYTLNSIPGFQFRATPDSNGTFDIYAVIDNVKVEAANDPVSVSNISVTRGGVDYGIDNAPVDSKQIKIKFDKDPGSDITKSISLNDGTNNVTLNGKYDSASKTYTATFGGLEAGKNYTLKINKGIMGLANDYSKTFSAASVPWETTFSDDFENTAVTNISTDSSTVLHKPNNWDVAVGTGATINGSNVGNSWIAADPGNASNKCLKIEKWHWANYRVQKNFEPDYESGQYRISFKVKNQETVTSSYLDIDMSDEAAITANANNMGTNRTMRISVPSKSEPNGDNTITFWNEVRKPTGELKNGENTHTNKFDTAKLRNQWIEFVMTFDLDNRTCKVTADDVLVEEFTLRDEYKLYGLQFRTIDYDNGGNHSIWFVDDVKVEKVSSPLSVSSVKFTKGDKEYETNNVPAGATGVKIVFSDDVTDYVKDCVTLTSGENNITVNGTYDKTTKTFTGTFDALTEDTAYVLKVGKNALFATEDYAASFTTKGGLQLNDITFTPGNNNAVSVNYDITRISGTGTAVVIAAVYDGDRVVQAVSDNVTFSTDGSGKGTINVTKTSAQTLKVFVWDSLNSFKPLFPVHPMTSGN